MSDSISREGPSINRVLLFAIRFLIAVGVPFGAGWAFAQTLTRNLWLAVIITILYELCLLMFGFFGKVWQRLESPLIDWVASSIMWRGEAIFSKTKRTYCQFIVYEHQVFDVKGLSIRAAHDLDLEHVFVELNVDPTPTHQASVDPFKVPESLREGKHDIWEYLAAPSLAHQHFVIIGPPGSGKTTLLRHLALILARRRKLPFQAHELHNLPIFLYLREYTKTIKDKPNYSLVEAVQDHIQRKWQQSMSLQWVARYLSKGKCLILLDGLDEVASVEMRRLMVLWVQQQMLAYGSNRFILTSRPYGYRDNPLDGVTVLEVHPFTPPQIQRFIQNWYLANELKSWGREDPGVHMRAREGAQDLLLRLHRIPALFALAVNPLLLTMIATVHRYRGSLPGSRIALYGEICAVFLGRRREATGIAQELSPMQKQQVLQPLAYCLMQQETQIITFDEACRIIALHLTQVTTGIQPDAFLNEIQNASGLFLERNPGFYSFAHKTFQEYLTAVYIKEQGLEQELLAQVENSWWHETIHLYCAQADATRIIEICLTRERPSITTLTLALECYEERLKVSSSLTRQIDTLFEQGIDDPDPERRRVIANAVLSRRLQQMTHLHDEVYVDTSMVSCAEYQVFLNEQYPLQTYHQPDHWLSPSFPTGQGHESVQGVRPSDAHKFCEWLTERDVGTWRYRLPSKSEQQQVNEKLRDAGNLKDNSGYWIEEGREFAWLMGGPPQQDNLVSTIQDLFTQDFDRANKSTLAEALEDAVTLLPSSFYSNIGARPAYTEVLTYAKRLPTPKLQYDPFFKRVLPSADPHYLSRYPQPVRDDFKSLADNLSRELSKAISRISTIAFDPTYPDALVLAVRGEFARGEANYNVLSPIRRSSSKARGESKVGRLARYLDFVRFSIVLSRATTFISTDARAEILLLLWCLRYLAQLLALDLLSRSSSHKGNQQVYRDEKALIDNYLDLYVTFALLQLRLIGQLPVREGILLVKERKTGEKQ